MKITYSINEYDSEGDIINHGLFLQFNGNVKIKVANNIKGYMDFVKQVTDIGEEVIDNNVTKLFP